jgi:hypothetical protein
MDDGEVGARMPRSGFLREGAFLPPRTVINLLGARFVAK